MTFDHNLNIESVMFIIKEKSNENYFMSIELYKSDVNLYSITYNEVMLLQLSYNFETNSCLSLNNLTKSNDLTSLIVGQNSTNNEKGIYYVDLTPNTFTTNASSIYSSSNHSTSYYFVDITQCVWPRLVAQLTKCNYPLPSFNLLNSYDIHVGKKFTKNPVFIPFTHCQNASFIISAINTNASNDIQWLVVDQLNKSIIIDLTQIYSVGNFNISMSAKMITYLINSTDTEKYTTINYFSNFEFSNENCVFVSSNSSYYLVVNQLTTFLLTFNDTEQDLISVTIHQNGFISTFVKTTNDTNKFIIMLQANEARSNPTKLVISYTDSYHKDVSFMQQTTIELYLFAVDPPSFATDLQVVHANRCSNTNVDLPAVFDPNGYNCTISLDPSTPAWVILNNTLMTFNTTDFRYNILEITIISLKIINEKNAWTKYNLTIETSNYTYPSFGVISNITAFQGIQIEIKLDLQNGLDIQAIDCANNNVITWIQFNKLESILILYPSNNYVQIQCAKLLSHDSCQNKIYSNEFTIFVIKNVILPPTLANTFGPLIIYPGKTKLFIIPDDLFISPQHSPLKYSVQVLECSVNTLLNVTISKYENSIILYLKSKDPKTCFISLSATDSNGQSIETKVEVDAQNCASKDCVECTSQYQYDCIKCITNYILGPSGICYLNTTSFSKSFENLFEICGLIILICLITNLILCFFIGIKSLYIIEFAHTIIIFIVSLLNHNMNLVKLISLVQIFKFDFGFIDYFNIRKIMFCKLGTDKIVSLNFYCQSTILNYLMFIIILILILFLALVALKHAPQNLKCTLKLNKWMESKIKKQKIAWLLIHLFLPFLWINLISDAIASSSHIFLSLLSFILFAVLLIILMIKMPSVFTFVFIENIDQNASAFLTLLTVLKSVLHALLFSFESQTLKIIILFTEFTLLVPFIVSNIMRSKGKKLFELYFTKMLGVKHSFLLVILIVLSVDSILSIQISNPQAIALLMTSFFCFCTIVDLGSVITLFFK